MVPNSVLRHHASPVSHVCVISKCKYSHTREFGRKKGLRPRSEGAFRSPCLLAVSGEAMDENDTIADISDNTLELTTQWEAHSTTLLPVSCSSLIPDGNVFLLCARGVVVGALAEEDVSVLTASDFERQGQCTIFAPDTSM